MINKRKRINWKKKKLIKGREERAVEVEAITERTGSMTKIGKIVAEVVAEDLGLTTVKIGARMRRPVKKRLK